MKIEKLYTLSQFIEHMETDKKRTDVERLIRIFQYNAFLKQPLKKEMFVNEIEKPIEESSLCVGGDRDKRWLEWQEAEKKVIFIPNKSDDFGFTYDLMWMKLYSDKHIEIKKSINSLYDLTEATNGQLKLKNIEL